ncbi:MAG: COR domain-containing protein [Bacteroidia bacterium]|nr:COR domain-containing protein [Bacteroidia bacterium]
MNVDINLDPFEQAVLRIEEAIDKDSKQLDLTGLKLTKLPKIIGDLPNLELLHLAWNELSSLPEEIGSLKCLKTLHLSSNKFENIPKQITGLKNLKEFYARKNLIEIIPDYISDFSNLELLDLFNNYIDRISHKIENLSTIKNLNLKGNRLKEIPLGLTNLDKLEKLILSDNQLVALPEEIGNLKNLQKLYLRDNRLLSVPKELAKLKYLERLDLKGNNLSDLPEEFLSLSNLQTNKRYDDRKLGLNLKGNQFNIPDQLYKREPLEIIQFINDLKNVEKIPQNNYSLKEAKLIFLGSGFVGKTSLIKMLTQGLYNSDEVKTDGIAINDWRIRVNDTEIVAHIWDFGGQEIMHATHRFFMTSRSVYVLVINPRIEDSYGDSELEYWLKLIGSYAGSVPIIIAINKCETHPMDIGKASLLEKYPNVIEIVETSCVANFGIESLKENIIKGLRNLPHLDDHIPESYLAIKEKVVSINKDYISYSEYENLTMRIAPELNDRSRQVLVDLLHDLGIVLNFTEDKILSDTYVINPEWITHGVYKIINSYALIANRGVITDQEIDLILDNYKYPTIRERQFIIGMMLKFELCYQIPDKPKTYYVPSGFAKDRPKIEWDNHNSDILRFQYHYNVLPPAIMSRFIVKVHSLINENNYWRYGAIIQKDGCKSLIKADLTERKIFIEVHGDGYKRDLLSFIRGQFDLIHRTYVDIGVKAMIPLDKYSKEVVDYKSLLIYEEMGMKDYFAPELRRKFLVKDLLDGVGGSSFNEIMPPPKEPLYSKSFQEKEYKSNEGLFILPESSSIFQKKELISQYFVDNGVEIFFYDNEIIPDLKNRINRSNYVIADFSIPNPLTMKTFSICQETKTTLIPIVIEDANWIHSLDLSTYFKYSPNNLEVTLDQIANWTKSILLK